MSRFLSPDDACVGVTAPSGRKYKGASFDVSDPRDARDLRRGGYTVAGVAGPSKAPGFECFDCGFQSFFKLCSRCGGSCERPDLVA